MTDSVAVRARLVDILRRDLIGPHPDHDPDLARERLGSTEKPSQWYLAGYIAPAEDEGALEAPDGAGDPDTLEDADNEADAPDPQVNAGASEGVSEPPSVKRRFLPSSVGLTVLLPPEVEGLEVRVTWGDYLTEPPLPEAVLIGDAGPVEIGEDGRQVRIKRPEVEWIRVPREVLVSVRIPTDPPRATTVVPGSASPQARGGLVIETHARTVSFTLPDGSRETVRVATFFLVNRRAAIGRLFSDVTYAFQARLELRCPAGFRPRRDIAGYNAADRDLRLADLHYRDALDYAVGRNSAADWNRIEAADGRVTRVWTDPLPSAEVERVAPNEDAALTGAVTFGMEALAERSAGDGAGLAGALATLPDVYAAWIAAQRERIDDLDASRRRETAARLVDDMERARSRIAAGIALLGSDANARAAFGLMNAAVAAAARRRNAGPKGDPTAQRAPTWRPFQLAFVLLNLSGLVDRAHDDREMADLLFFPTGGGKTEAYLGLAAFVIALRRIRGPGVLGAGLAVIMRYTLRLLTLDQLARAAGVVCALELMRLDPQNRDSKGRRLLGDWPIEIGLWVGSDASPNVLKGTGKSDDGSAVARVRRYRTGRDKRAPAPLKACPWCGTAFTKDSFSVIPNDRAPTNLEIRCDNTACDFSGDRALPVLTVDEVIYRRLPAFLIATVDKFASLPWVGETGSFFGHVDHFKEGVGFYGAAGPKEGHRLDNGWTLDPPDLIIQDELHLIAGPLGTVAGLYETAIDRLCERQVGGRRVRPKIVASTATVRRAEAQIAALFDRQRTAIFPPPGIDRTDSFFARTVPASTDPARLYVGIAAQGKGPKLVFLHALTTLLAAAEAEAAGEGGTAAADPYLTALCYFNALRELGGARRIVEDEVRARAGTYGAKRRRLAPVDVPFHDREIGEPMELTSRVSTDAVAAAKQRLEAPFGGDGDTIDVALATNMISVGLDISRLGLMLVQGQPKTAAEYIQATSRVGRDHRKPGLVVTVLNLHKPRDRMHYEQFGHFHRTFYRAVEATSVTPWAARALDRALAAVVVAAARHLNPALTPDGAASAIRDCPTTRAAVRDAILARAPEEKLIGGRAALAQTLDGLLDAWADTAADKVANGSPFSYAERKSPQRLLHMPLARELDNLSAEHVRFQAGRSMRDVEPGVILKVKDPAGRPIANADDI